MGAAPSGPGGPGERRQAGTGVEANGANLGFLGSTTAQANGNHTDVDERVAVVDTSRMKTDLAALLKRADVAIVSMHAGIEYAPRPNQQQTAFARAAIEAGARVVVGHHPHVVQPWERYANG